ncbi:MAG: SCO family protein [Beijerinckiaceae bacterium]|jgi:protein SCO1|nr:SCO family protein [Beijerinckiaceae bacterium]
MTPAQKRLIAPIICFGLGLVLLLATAWVTFVDRGANVPAVRIGGPFALEAQDGRLVSNKDFAGKPNLVFFGFTNCPDVCPTTLFEISEIFRKMGPDKKISALFITVDPERDSAAKMKDYLSSFDKRIVGLTGSRPAIDRVIKSFRAYSRKVPGKDGEYTMDHSSIVYLMNKRGEFVNGFNIKQPPEKAAAELEKYL